MNTIWQTFLQSQRVITEQPSSISYPVADKPERCIYPLTHFAVLTVSGKDAAKLLQGQVTCNINDINENKSSLAAMCNPKGRVIATFLVVKNTDAYVLILPVEMAAGVKQRLQMYILRSDVKISDSSNEFCLIGLSGAAHSTRSFVTETLTEGTVAIVFPAYNRQLLLLANAEQAVQFWTDKINKDCYHVSDLTAWFYLDILAGIPWVTKATSEEFIPQMLNLDKLGAISFTKGCYTGQEIVARTHYLGKAKRELYLAECQTTHLPEVGIGIVNVASGALDVVGKVLLAMLDQHSCKLLVILSSDEAESDNLALQVNDQTKIKILAFAHD